MNRVSVDLVLWIPFHLFVAGGDTASMLRSDLLVSFLLPLLLDNAGSCHRSVCCSNCELIAVNCLMLLAAS